MSEIDPKEILMEIISAESLDPPGPDEVTAQEVARAAGISPRTARERLNRLVREGRAETRLARISRDDFRKVRVWRLKKN